MLRKLVVSAKRHPFRTGLLTVVATLLLVLTAVETVRWIQWRTFAHAAERVTNTIPSGHGRMVGLTFSALGETHTVHVRVDDAELEALRSFPAEEAFQYRGRWRERFVQTFIDMQADSDFVDDLAAQLHVIARHQSYDRDEFLELVVSAVQSIPYAAAEDGLRTPAEVIAEGEGICTEKSITLAALLVHEGYDTVMWSFRSQHHVALGVATNGPSYRDSGYAFIETTHPALIGQVDRAYLSSGPIHGPPEQIDLGGVKRYEAGDEVAYILRVLSSSIQRSRRFSAYATYAERAVSRREELEVHAAEHAEALDVVRFIGDHVDDRPMVYETLLSLSPVS